MTEAGSPTVWRLRVATGCVLLTALSFAQQPGRIAADTKVDLVVSPAAWLARALHAWDPAGNFGQMQNQAYGYLFPMGPFFLFGKLAGLPAWVIQRLWWALLLCLAFTGVVLLAGRLGIGTPTARLVGGMAFALAPRILSEIGAVSVEAWPTALAPWVLLPLVGPALHGGRWWRAVVLSALAVAAAGGVNATAVLAVIPLPLLWLIHARARLVVVAGWLAAVACATAWWVVPLLVLGRYSAPFLDYIETAATTTRPTDAVTTLRGASHWLAYLQSAYGPGWPAGWRLATEAPLVVATVAVTGLAIAGLCRRGLPHRQFLVTGVLIGVAIVGLGHLSDLDGLFAVRVHDWLDATGAPLRNLHKFDAVLRLPLALGLTHLLGTAFRAAAVDHTRRRAVHLRASAIGAAAVTALAVTAGPALAGGLAGRGSFLEVPGYWRSAAAWLDAHAAQGRTLVVPGARFPSYLWGAPGDEMVQPLLRSAWAVRNSIPLAPPDTIRLLDAVESVLTTGTGSPGLAAVLSRAGVRYLLVRADLDTGRSDSTRQLAVRATLASSPGIVPVTTFGPLVGGQARDFAVDRGLDVPVPALQVFAVQPAAPPVSAYDVSATRTVVGGPESLLALADAGELGPAPTVLAGDLPDGLTTGGVLLTDGLRRREVTFGQARDNASATLTADDPWRLDQPAHDYGPAWQARWQTVARYLGVRSIAASSAYSQALPLAANRPEHQPYAALDGDPDTSWRSAPGTVATGQWLEVTFDQPRRVRQVKVTVDRGADSIPTRIAVQAGNETHSVDVTGATVTVPFDALLTVGAVRVTVERVWDVRLGHGGVGISELAVPGVQARRTLVVPAGPAGAASTGDATPVAMATDQNPPVVVLGAAPSVPSCYFLDARPYCSPDAGRGSEDGSVLDRTVPAETGAYAVRLWARPRAGPELSAAIDRALAGPDTPRATASSDAVAEPAARPGAVVDGNPDTVWSAGDEDRAPWLRLDWPTRRVLTGLRITLGDHAAATRPWSVTVLSDSGTRTGTLDADGVLAFDPPVHTDTLTVLFTGGTEAISFAPYQGRFETLPVGVGELTTLPASAASGPSGRDDTVVRLPCGSGPTVYAGGRSTATAFTGTVADLLERRELPMRLCATGDTVRSAAADGPSRVVASGTAYATPTRLTLVPGSAAAPDAAPADTVQSISRWKPTRRQVELGYRADARILVLRENANAGWRARLAGSTLRPVVVDGWQQGWIVPAGASGTVAITFAPDTAYRIGLAGGLVLAGVLALTALPAGPAAILPALPRPRRRSRLLVLAGLVALMVAGGYAAIALVVAGVAAYLATRVWPRRELRGLERWFAPGLFALAGVLSLRAAAPHLAARPQLAGLAALVALWLAVTFARPPG